MPTPDARSDDSSTPRLEQQSASLPSITIAGTLLTPYPFAFVAMSLFVHVEHLNIARRAGNAVYKLDCFLAGRTAGAKDFDRTSLATM